MAAARQCEQFLAELNNNNFIDMTGISQQVFSYIYIKYCGPTTPLPRPSGLYRLLVYYKLYPIQKASIFPDRATLLRCSLYLLLSFISCFFFL